MKNSKETYINFNFILNLSTFQEKLLFVIYY